MKKLSLRQQVAKSSLWNFSTLIISKTGGLIFTIILARFLMPEGFGIYTLATSIALIFLAFADLGINQTMIRYVSLEIERNRKKAIAYFNYLVKIKVLLSLLISITLLILAYPLAYFIFNKPDLFIPLLILCFYIFIMALEGFYSSLFYINNKVYYVTIREIILQFSRIGISLILFYLFTKTFYINGAIVSLLMSILLVFIFILFYSRKFFNFLFKSSESRIEKRKVLKFVGYLTIGSLSLIFFGYIDTLMLGLFVSSTYIGYYKAASALVFGVAGLFTFVNVFLPVLTQVKKEKLSLALDKIFKYSFIITIPATFGLIFLSKYSLRLIYGYEYLPAAIPLYFLSPLIFLAVNVGIFLVLFSARERPQSFAKITLAASVINVILNYILISYFLNYSELLAISGAAIATLISWVFYFFGSFYLAKKELGFKLQAVNLIKPIIASVIMSIFLYFFNFYIRDMTLIKGFSEVLIGIAIYFLTLFLIGGLKKEDFNVIYFLIK